MAADTTLRMGDRVMWSIGRCEYGFVRWIGPLPEDPQKLYAGVEFVSTICSQCQVRLPQGSELDL